MESTRILPSSAIPCCRDTTSPSPVLVPTAFADGIGEVWWLALQQVIGREPRVSLMMGRDERHFDVPGLAEKHELYEYLMRWLRTLPPPNLSAAIKDLCTRYSVDLAAM